MNQENGMYPKDIHNRLKEISESLLKESRETFLNRQSTRSKLLKEFENKGIFPAQEARKTLKGNGKKMLKENRMKKGSNMKVIQ
jgi:hypothetical protein